MKLFLGWIMLCHRLSFEGHELRALMNPMRTIARYREHWQSHVSDVSQLVMGVFLVYLYFNMSLREIYHMFAKTFLFELILLMQQLVSFHRKNDYYGTGHELFPSIAIKIPTFSTSKAHPFMLRLSKQYPHFGRILYTVVWMYSKGLMY